MYSRYIRILKALQVVIYCIIVLLAMLITSETNDFISFVFLLIIPGIFNYIITQGLIAIIDLLNSIEANTRTSRKLTPR
jgi:uncharacterized membrane protein